MARILPQPGAAGLILQVVHALEQGGALRAAGPAQPSIAETASIARAAWEVMFRSLL